MRLVLLALALLVAATPASTAAPVLAAPTAAAASPLPVVGQILPSLFGTPGLGQILDHVEDTANLYRDDFMAWGSRLYVAFFVLQFLLLGITMVVKGPFAIATYRPIHALNPFANFFFFLLAGTLGFMFITNSAYINAAGDPSGWVQWIYDWFSEAGDRTGCTRTVLVFDACDAPQISWLGMRLSGLIAVVAEASGNSSNNPINSALGAGGASTSVFAAFAALAIQLTLVEAAFILCIVTAPLFLSVVVFRPFSGIATGFISFIAYVGVKLFVLKLVAGMAGFVAEAWLTSILTNIISGMIVGAAFGGSIGIGSFFSFSLTIITASLLFLSLTMYLPTKIAGMVSQRLNLDINGILFRGEFPVQIA